jgi:chromosomal replication initiation ATPase DnaA
METKSNYYIMPGLFIPKNELITILATNYNYSPEVMIQKNRSSRVIMVKMMICIIYRHHYKMTLDEIAEILKNDHSTILHRLKTAYNLYTMGDKDFLEIVENCPRELKKTLKKSLYQMVQKVPAS